MSNDMKFVKRNPRLRQHFSDSLDEGRRHVDADRADGLGVAAMRGQILGQGAVRNSVCGPSSSLSR